MTGGPRMSPSEAATTAGHALEREPIARLFRRYLRFGLVAWGGPFSQITMIREELVDREKWIPPEQFNRTLAVYQALPGPEAHELCVHYGMKARGRLGGMLAGLGFMMPGFLLMFLLSWAYLQYGLASPVALALLAGFRPAVAALLVRAMHRLSERAFRDLDLVLAGLASAAATVLGMPFYSVLLTAGLSYFFVRRDFALLGRAFLLLMVVASAATSFDAALQPDALLPEAGGPVGAGAVSLLTLLLSGLKAGLLTFGGAYTAFPFLQGDAVGPDGWMTNDQFLDGVALGGILPAPLIIFSTFVGYLGAGPLGALVITIGVFLPAFGFTLLGYRHLERAIGNPRLHDFLDGVTAGVIGLILVTALVLGRAALQDVYSVDLFLGALLVLYVWKSRANVPVAVLASGLVGLLVYT